MHLNRFLMAAGAALLLIAGAFAEEPTVKLPTVVVTGQTDGPLTVPDARSAQQQLDAVAGGTNFIDAGTYEKGRASNLQDVFSMQPGVFAESRFGTDEARISIRGSGVQRTFHGRGLLVLQDGVPINLADGMFDMQAIEPLAAQYVEVWRGANALQYGSTDLGGAVNFVSHTGYDAALGQARFEAGSYGYLRGQVSSGAVVGKADYYVTATESSAGGFRDWDNQDAQRFLANFGYRFTPDLESRLYFSWAKSDLELPGSLTKQQMYTDPTQANAGNQIANHQKRDYDQWRLSDTTTLRLDPDAELTFTPFWWRKDLDHPISPYLSQHIDTGGLFTRYENRNDLLGAKNRFSLGFNPMWTNTHEKDYVNLAGVEGAPVAKRDTLATNLALYGEDQYYFLPKVALVVGSQLSFVDLHSERYFPNSATGEDDYLGFSPKVGLLYDLAPKVQAYANLSRSFEPPGFTDDDSSSNFVPALGGASPATGELKDLKAQTATTAEVGSRGEAGRFAWDVAFYQSWVDNELLSTVSPQGVNLSTVNATPTTHQGVEVGFDVRLLDNLLTSRPDAAQADQLVLRTVYDWNHFHFVDSPSYGNNAIPGIPEHYFKEELTYEHPCGFYAGPSVEASLQKYAVNMQNDLYADPYALLGAKIGYKSKRGFSVFLEGRNLTDQIYAAGTGVTTAAAATNPAQFMPGDGRSLYGGIEWKY